MASNYNPDDPNSIKVLTDQLLTEKEKLAESFLAQFLKSENPNDKTNDFSADLSMQQRLMNADKKLNECSMILAHKYQPILKEVIAHQQEKQMNEKYGVIKAKPKKEEDWSKQYLQCFTTFLNSPDCVSLKAANLDLLKHIDIRDYFSLVFWAMNTCKREAGDNMLQLIICGKTSCGKSAIFENPIQEIAHNLTADQGCGRFLTEGKSTLLLHDCNLEILVKGKDVDKLKSITRTEPISTKVHSKTKAVKPMHVLATSNKHLYAHRFKTAEKIGMSFRTLYKSDIQPTKSIHEADIDAVRNRYLEVFVRQRPVMPPQAMPTSGNFTRNHLIRGLFFYIGNMLQKYQKDDFSSEYLYLYALTGMTKNLWMIQADYQEPMKIVLMDLFKKFDLDEEQQHQCWLNMEKKEMKSEIPEN